MITNNELFKVRELSTETPYPMYALIPDVDIEYVYERLHECIKQTKGITHLIMTDTNGGDWNDDTGEGYYMTVRKFLEEAACMAETLWVRRKEFAEA